MPDKVTQELYDAAMDYYSLIVNNCGEDYRDKELEDVFLKAESFLLATK